MNRLNRKVEYALMALKYMSGRYAGQIVSVKEICLATHTPFDATSRVMQQLAQHKLLKSEHGAHGGYLLACDLSRVNLLEVIEIVSGPVGVARCTSHDNNCEFLRSCNVASPLQVLNQKLLEFYRRLSISEVLQTRESRTGVSV